MNLDVPMKTSVGTWFMKRARRAMEKPWELETYLLPEEEKALAEQIESAGISGWIHVRSHGAGGDRGPLGPGSTVVISRRAVRDLRNCPELLNAHLSGNRIVDISQLLKELRGRVRIRHADAWTFLLSSTYQGFFIRLYFYLKTFAESLLAAALLALFSPLLAVLAAVVFATTGRPVLYRQKRLGYRGRPFFLYKFRTMPVTAEGGGPQWARENDDRVTPVGRWLRKTHLDELPQLMNVVRRELSFVGPRPERPEFYKILNEEIPLFSLRLLVRPGVTGWAQVNQKYAGNVEECKTKLEYDLYYVQNMSPLLDLRVALYTLKILLWGDGGR